MVHEVGNSVLPKSSPIPGVGCVINRSQLITKKELKTHISQLKTQSPTELPWLIGALAIQRIPKAVGSPAIGLWHINPIQREGLLRGFKKNPSPFLMDLGKMGGTFPKVHI